MGLLRRLFGGGPVRVETVATFFTQVRDDAVVEVAGEAYRQGNVALARAPGPDELPPGLPAPPSGQFKAMLLREPTNQYDSNAVKVLLWAGRDWTMSGYLPRHEAVTYRLLFDHLQAGLSDRGAPEVAAIVCDAARINERGGLGVVLHLGTPGECIVELATEDVVASEGHRWRGASVAFTGRLVTTIHGVPLDRMAQAMLARWAGCEFAPRVTKKTEALIVADANDATGNLQRARDYGIPIITEQEFLAAIGLAPGIVGRDVTRWARG